MDFAKKSSRTKRGDKLKFNPLWLVAPLAGLLLLIVCIFVYKQVAVTNGILATRITAVKGWVSDKKNSLQQSAARPKSKKMVLNKVEEDAPIHFEFYSSLQDTQITTPLRDKSSDEIIIKKSNKNSLAANVIFTNSEELEKELSEKIKQAHARTQ